jgi:hypothetical protein
VGVFVHRAQNSAMRLTWTTFGLECAGVTVVLTRTVAHQAIHADQWLWCRIGSLTRL